MTTYVLVSGATWGGWCWKRLVPLLRAAGHEVYTPTFTGLGERAHLLDRTIGLSTHIQDVLGVLEYEDLTGVVLVGHSYGGVVISAVAEQAGRRLAHLVYLNGLVPQDGQADLDLIAPDAAALIRRQAAEEGEGWRWLPPFSAQRFGLVQPGDAAWVQARLRPQPLQSLEEPVHLTGAAVQLPRTYIYSTGAVGAREVAQRIKAEPGWRYRELEAGHVPMITAPHHLAALLLDVPAGAAGHA